MALIVTGIGKLWMCLISFLFVLSIVITSLTVKKAVRCHSIEQRLLEFSVH